MGDEWIDGVNLLAMGYKTTLTRYINKIISFTYIRWDTTAELTSSRRVHKGTHRGVISYKSALDEETPEGGTVTSS